LHDRHPVRRSPRLSISMSLQWLKRSMPHYEAILKSAIAPLGGRRCQAV
jgi:hypothetical protein